MNIDYKIIGKDNLPIEEVATLAALGFQDKESITISRFTSSYLFVKNVNTGEIIPLKDVNLDIMTNEDLIAELVACNYLPRNLGKIYKMISPKTLQPLEEVVTLAALGIQNATTVSIVAKPEGIAHIILYAGNTNQLSPVYDIKLDKVTNEELISTMISDGIIPEVPGHIYKMISPKTFQPVEEVATLESLGVQDGNCVSIICCFSSLPSTDKTYPINDIE